MGFSLLVGTVAFPAGVLVTARQSSASATSTTPAVAAEQPGHRVTLTAYNAVPEQTDASPFETASGAYSNPEIIAARSVDLADELPFGTIIELDGSTIGEDGSCGYSVVEPEIGYRVIGDSMNRKFTDRIDVLFDDSAEYVSPNGRKLNAANVLGICHDVTIRVVGYVDVNHIPETQRALKALVEKSTTLALR